MFKRFASLFCASALMALPALSLAGKLKIKVFPALAPNAFGSPSWDGWVQNALYAIANNKEKAGDPNQPTFYRRAPHRIAANQIIVTGFPSWLGDADPVGDYGPQYGGEYGNRMQFGLHIWGNGTKFCIAQLGFTAASTDTGNTLGFSFPAGSYDYGMDRYGIIYNMDGTTTIINTPGNPLQFVDELVSRGSGNAYAVYNTIDFPGTTLQNKIDNAVLTIPKMDFSGTYTIGSYSGTGKVRVRAVKAQQLDPDTNDENDN